MCLILYSKIRNTYSYKTDFYKDNKKRDTLKDVKYTLNYNFVVVPMVDDDTSCEVFETFYFCCFVDSSFFPCVSQIN